MSAVRRVSNPPSPWTRTEVEYLDEVPAAEPEIFEDQTRSILSRNDPAKAGFEFGLNPYRGCQHACAYCEARRRHELLGFGAGTDFDTKIVVEPNAPECCVKPSSASRGEETSSSSAAPQTATSRLKRPTA
jgi:hypothetical protein